MDDEQFKDIIEFTSNSEKTKKTLFLKYLEIYDPIIQKKLKKVKKYVSYKDLQTDAIFAIEDIFTAVRDMLEIARIKPESIDVPAMFKKSFLVFAEKDRRENFPMYTDKSPEKQ